MLWNNGKPVAKCSWEILFFESEDTEIFKADRNKLVTRKENWKIYLTAWHASLKLVSGVYLLL